MAKKANIRRQRARQLRAESTESVWAYFNRRIGLWPTLITLAFFSVGLLVATSGEPALRYSPGQRINQPIYARITFTVRDPQATQDAIKQAREQVPDHYRVSSGAIDRIASDVNELFLAGQAETFERFQEKFEAQYATEQLYNFLREPTEAQKQLFDAALGRLKDRLAQEYVVSLTDAPKRSPSSTASHVLVVRPDGAEPAPNVNEDGSSEQVRKIDLVQTGSRILNDRARDLAALFDSPLRPAIASIIHRSLETQPILVYDEQRTSQAMAAAEREVTPRNKTFEKDKPFVFPRMAEPAGQAAESYELGLTASDIELLRTEDSAYLAFVQSDEPEAVKLRQKQRMQYLGVAIALAVLTVSLFVYVGLYQPRVFEVPSRSLAFAGLLLLGLIVVRLINTRLPFPEIVIAPVIMAAAILTIAYPQRFAAGVTMMYVVMVSLLVEGNMGVMVTLFATGYATALMLHSIRTRTKIITAGLAAAAIAFLTTMAFRLIDRGDMTVAISPALIAAGSTILAALLIQAGLPIIERVFKVATALTLLEWRDANRPLLQRLAREAPGTYNHSLVLGTMAEAGCEAIRANGLLAHVGALYHDIGKIPKAEYFAENQEASINRHDKLAPSMSLLIILGHVKDGIEMAKEYGLPRVLLPFIAEHHGTTVVKYFHHMASEKQPHIAVGRHDREVSEAEFRYPGPKPRTKETAILMLCDGVEGAVRALHEPTAGRIESVVHQVLQARLKDGQFDDCDITLRELHLVEEALVKSLCRFYHGRVAYPKEKPAHEKTQLHTVAAETQKEQFAG